MRTLPRDPPTQRSWRVPVANIGFWTLDDVRDLHLLAICAEARPQGFDMSVASSKLSSPALTLYLFAEVTFFFRAILTPTSSC